MQLTEHQKAIAIDIALGGGKRRDMRAALGLDKMTFWRICRTDHEFSGLLAQAIEAGQHEVADDLEEESKTTTDHRTFRVRSETVRWMIERRNRKDYGQKLELEVNQVLDIAPALEARRVFALPAQRGQQIKEAEYQLLSDVRPTDNETVGLSEDPEDIDIFS